MKYLGDFSEDATVYGRFSTKTSGGAPVTLAGSPALAVYKNGGLVESTAGITLTVDFDARTGAHLFAIDTSADAFYSANADYGVMLTAGTVDGVSVAGTWVGFFSVENRSISKVSRNLFSVIEAPITLGTQTSFTITGGPANDLANAAFILWDTSTGSHQHRTGSYTGSTGTITLTNAPDFTLVNGDKASMVWVGANSVDLNDGAITANKIATDAISAGKVAADAVTKIQTGLATSAQATAIESLSRLAASAGTGTVGITDNGATLTLSFKDTDGVTEVANVTFTKATGSRTRNA